MALLDELFEDFAPDQLIACNGHPMILEALARARKRGITTAFAVRGFGYYEARYFQDVDHAFTCSQFLTDLYRDKVGLVSTPIEPPLEWSSVLAPVESRAFVTFVNPSPHKGLLLVCAPRRHARLQAARYPNPGRAIRPQRRLAERHPRRGLQQYPQIMAAPPVPAPSDYFALTRILVVPSVWEEPFGRVAAEAMINAIPPLVSNRGSLPQVVGGDFSEGGGGRVLPIPDWMTFKTTKLPSEQEVEPWYEAVCALWDDAVLYRSVASRAHQIAEERYSEKVSRKKHVDYFSSLKPGGRPLACRKTEPSASGRSTTGAMVNWAGVTKGLTEIATMRGAKRRHGSNKRRIARGGRAYERSGGLAGIQ